MNLHFLEVRDVNEFSLMGLELNVSSLFEVHVSDNHIGAFIKTQVLHHPDWNMAHVLLGDELQRTTVGLLTDRWVRNHEGHRVRRVNPRQLAESRLRHDN